MIYFITYDISDVESRNNVARILENIGVRVQYSFFRCAISSKRLEELVAELILNIDLKTDSLHIHFVCEHCFDERIELQSEKMSSEKSYCIL